MSTARARELAVLSVLAAHPAHGYEIAKAFSSGPLALLGLSRAAVYAVLDRFKARGWVSEAVEQGESYPDRRVLTLTNAAHAELERLRLAVGDDTVAPNVPLLALLMVHDGGAELGAETLTRLIAQRTATLAGWPRDADHEASATQRLARAILEAEIAVLMDLATPGG